eukprot:TRINITY_DN13047_c0_g1_i1.p2 TRINITY_DN13047_c0_g1~~TRINITY_DN13047_c0_g1_i1.p2  ORF type:complete len:299 (+),score=70.35 TRINITY_DN13047_c0_g1_i1:138-1034(+)
MALADQLLPRTLESYAQDYLQHDIPSFDFAGAVVGSSPGSATILAKKPLVTAGYAFVAAVFKVVECSIEWHVPEGTFLADASGTNRIPIGTASGPTNRLLQAERTALELLIRACSVASTTRRCVEIAKAAGFTGRIAGTRKVSPGSLRYAEKAALHVGGADTHRMSLATCIMLKDNHIDACGGDIRKAVTAAKAAGGFTTKVEVEARSVEEALAAAAAGADVIMLDNFTPEGAVAAAADVRRQHPAVILEMSGGIDEERLPGVAKALAGSAVDILSMGCLTQRPAPIDISMKLNKGGS